MLYEKKQKKKQMLYENKISRYFPPFIHFENPVIYQVVTIYNTSKSIFQMVLHQSKQRNVAKKYKIKKKTFFVLIDEFF